MRPIQTPSKLPRVGTTIFTVMSQLAAKHGAVNLGQGFPDFDCDPRLQQRLTDAMQAGHNQYAPMTGVPALREAIASKNHALYGHRHDPDAEITITAGATQALMATILALLPAGDEAIVLEPAYDSYAPAIALAGGRPVFVPLDHAQGYAPDWDAVRAAVTRQDAAHSDQLSAQPNRPHAERHRHSRAGAHRRSDRCAGGFGRGVRARCIRRRAALLGHALADTGGT